MTDDAPRSHQATEHRRWTDVLKHRWPTALGVTVATLTAYNIDLDDGILEFLSPLIIWTSAGTSWPPASSATPPGTPSTFCET